MRTQDLSDFHPDTGIDRQQLRQLRQRFLQLNATRLERTRAALSERAQCFIDLLPLMLHINHPLLPGYRGADTPCGVPYYKPDTQALRAARQLAMGFTLKKTFHRREPALEAIFLMGSIGTIAHSERSDLDIWVCHKHDLGAQSLNRLQQKCDEISDWAWRELRLEAHLFLVQPETFIDNQSAMSVESSGSAQRHLLLDEFYRSAVWMAGKTPLWWLVPADCEGEYRSFTDKLLGRKFVRRQDVLDFGPMAWIPTEEYLGAGIWQLYKAINAPHKSLLKLLLLEAYARNGAAEPLALAFKRQVQAAPPDPDRVDSYLLIYHRIERHLSQDPDRLALARRCFYLKVGKPLTRPPRAQKKSWQRQLLESLVHQWQWPESTLASLDNHRRWKAHQLTAERDSLIRELSKSYRLLGGLGQDAFASASIDSEDLAILGRKLHAAFERKAGKIERINPGISEDVSEGFVTLTRQADERWALFRCKSAGTALQTPVKTAPSAPELLLWGVWNGVITQGTHLDMPDSQTPPPPGRQQLVSEMQQWLPDNTSNDEQDPFAQPAQVTGFLLTLNFARTPYQALEEAGLKRLSEQSDALNYSGLNDNLVQLADLAYANSWQEVIVRHFQKHALVESLVSYLRLAPPHAVERAPAIRVLCPDPQFGHLIASRVEALFAAVTACFYQPSTPPGSRFVFALEQEFVALQLHRATPEVTHLAGEDELLAYLETPQTRPAPVTLDRRALPDSPLHAILANAGQEALFFERRRDGVIYSYRDRFGGVVQMPVQHLSHTAFIAPLLRFIANAKRRLSAQGELFASGAVESEPVGTLSLFELEKTPEGYVAQPKHRAPKAVFSDYTDIKVIAEPSPSGQIEYSLYCNDQPFSADSGTDPFADAAAYIRRQRTSGKRYHCHISDLDLTACLDILAPKTGLTLVHYLREKRSIEALFNQKIEALSN